MILVNKHCTHHMYPPNWIKLNYLYSISTTSNNLRYFIISIILKSNLTKNPDQKKKKIKYSYKS